MELGDLIETFDGQLMFVTRIGDWESSGRSSGGSQYRNVWGLLYGSIYQCVQSCNGSVIGKPFILNVA